MSNKENYSTQTEDDDLIDVCDLGEGPCGLAIASKITEFTIGETVLPVIPPISEAPLLSPHSQSSTTSQETTHESPADTVTRYMYNFQLAQSKKKLEADEPDPEDTESEDGTEGDRISRKEKSLGLLCQRFLLAMKAETEANKSNTVHLESVARKMNVEKRRIYDIVNVMEALEAMSKTNKSFYHWHGLEDLPKLMADLQREAAEERLPARIMKVEQAMCSFTELSPRGNKGADTVGSLISCQEMAIISSSPLHKNDSGYFGALDSGHRSGSKDRNSRNSLAQLCRRFLMVLLCNPKTARKVSLDVASTVLIKDPETEGFEPPSRSRCRRLYDIANVLVAMGLIKKVHYLFGTKKIPLFVYSGPEPDENGTFDPAHCLEQAVLSSPISCPQTPLSKGLGGLGKRSQSDINLSGAKLARFTSDFGMSSMMHLAELADQERKRMDLSIDNLHQSPVSSLRTSSVSVLPKPQLTRQQKLPLPLGVPSPMHSPLTTNNKKYMVKVGNAFQFSPLSQQNTHAGPTPNFTPIVLPKTPTWVPSPQTDFAAAFLRNIAVASRAANSTVFSRVPQQTQQMNGSIVQPTQAVSMTPKHSMSNILGKQNVLETSTKGNVLGISIKDNLNHLATSPFQLVKKSHPTGGICSPIKKPLGTINRM